MEITSKDIGTTKVVSIEGKLNTNTSPDAEDYLMELIDNGVMKIVLNLEVVDYISSTGLRVMLFIGKKLNGKGGELRLSNLNDTVQEIFDISGFSTILNVFGDESEALDGF
jgi:anti-sigma B factor antagonist